MNSWVVIYGTRPELTKIQSVVRALVAHGFHVKCWHTGQHTDLLQATIDSPRYRIVTERTEPLDIDPSPDPGQYAAWVAQAVAEKLALESHIQGVIVQGDTSSAYGGAMGARSAGHRIAHVEAGVRSGDVSEPWPEEHIRVGIARVSRWHFAPTDQCARHLEAEGLGSDVMVTGNTGIDDLLQDGIALAEPEPRVLLTLHRRESLDRLGEMVAALNHLAERRPGIQFVWPVHPNPAIQAVSRSATSITCVPPLGARAFRQLMARSQLVVTDSGGVQEEAATLGVPCVVARRVTDRPEAIQAGIARLGGVEPAGLWAAVREELDHPTMKRTPTSVYGDGHAGERIAEALARWGRAAA